MVSTVAKKLAAGILALWYGGALCGSLIQERGVGWKNMRRNGRMLGFVNAMFLGGSVETLIALAVYITRGKVAAAKLTHRMSRAFYNCITEPVWGKIRVENAELLPLGDEGCIYVANHTSTLDTAVIYFLPNNPQVVGVGKSILRLVPGIGGIIQLGGGIFVSRGKHGTLASLVESGTDRLNRGMSVGIFPQGTRRVPRLDKPVYPFKKGAFVLADKTRAKIVPLTFLYPSNFMSAPTPPGVKIIVHPPVVPTGDGDVDSLMHSIEATINKPLRAMLEEEEEAKKSA